MARPRLYGQDVRTKIRELYRLYPIKAVAELAHVSRMTVRRELGFEPMERRINRKRTKL